MGYGSFKIDTVSTDGAYQYPFKKYTYSASSGGLESTMVLLVADKTQPKIDE